MKHKIMLIRVTGVVFLLCALAALVVMLAFFGFIGKEILERIESKPEGASSLAVICSLYVAYLFWRRGRVDPRTKKYELPTPAENRLGSWVVRWMAAYAIITLLFGWVIDIYTLPIWMKVLAALSFALPVGGVIGALLKYLSDESDEYLRLLMMRSVVGATGLTLFLLTAWGSLELYAGMPHFPIQTATPVFCLMFAMTALWVRRRYA